MSDTVLVGRNSGRIITQQEETYKFPKLDVIYAMVTGSDISRLFLSEKHFINYIKDIAIGAYPLEDKLLAFEDIFHYIKYEMLEDNDLDSIITDEEFSNVLYNNFNDLYEIHNPTKKGKKK